FSSRRRHTSSKRDWSSDVCSSDLPFVAPFIDRDSSFFCSISRPEPSPIFFLPTSPALTTRLGSSQFLDRSLRSSHFGLPSSLFSLDSCVSRWPVFTVTTEYSSLVVVALSRPSQFTCWNHSHSSSSEEHMSEVQYRLDI